MNPKRVSGRLVTGVGCLFLFTPPLNAQSDCAPAWIPDDDALTAVSNGPLNDFVAFDDGSGLALYAAARQPIPNDPQSGAVLRWDGEHWNSVGTGAARLQGDARVLTVHDDGDGPKLYVGGRFLVNGSQCVMRWTGIAWEPIGTLFTPRGSNGPWVHALCSHDDGSGRALFIGGQFSQVNGVTLDGIGKWTGVGWSTLDGVSNNTLPGVWALNEFDFGAGNMLLAGGSFTQAGTTTVQHVAAWNGAGWSGVGSTIGASITVYPYVHELLNGPAGSGVGLWACGGMNTPSWGLAEWNGTNWTGRGQNLTRGGLNSIFVRTMCVHNDGSGPAVYVGGNFTRFGSQVVRRVGRWDASASAWRALGAGLGSTTNDTNQDSFVFALASFDDGSTVGPALFASGSNNLSGPTPNGYFARWGCLKGDLNCDGAVDFFDIDPFLLALFAPGDYATVYPACRMIRGDMNGDSNVDFFDIDGFVARIFAP